MARPRQVTDEEIMEAARRCLLEEGPGIPTSAIAERVGLSQAALFKRFGTKNRLIIQACSLEAVPQWIGHVSTPPDPTRPVRDQLEEIAYALLKHLRHIMPRIAVLKANGIGPEEVLGEFEVPPPALGHRAMSAWLRQAIELDMLSEFDTDTVAFAFMGAMHGRSMLNQFAGDHLPPLDSSAYVREVVRVMFEGIGGEASPPGSSFDLDMR